MIRRAVLNHLLAQRADLRALLARHAGRRGAIVVPPFTVAFMVNDAGLLDAVAGEAEATITIAPWLLPRLALGDAGAAREVRLDGDAALAADLAQVLQSLDWDAEHDLARLVGDIPAHRIATTARDWVGDPRAIARNVAETAAEYLQEEASVLATRPAVAHFNAEVDRLRDDAARLAKRIAVLEQC